MTWKLFWQVAPRHIIWNTYIQGLTFQLIALLLKTSILGNNLSRPFFFYITRHWTRTWALGGWSVMPVDYQNQKLTATIQGSLVGYLVISFLFDSLINSLSLLDLLSHIPSKIEWLYRSKAPQWFLVKIEPIFPRTLSFSFTCNCMCILSCYLKPLPNPVSNPDIANTDKSPPINTKEMKSSWFERWKLFYELTQVSLSLMCFCGEHS